MPYSLVRSTDAAAEPLTTSEAKAQLRVSGSGEDTLIDNLVKTARSLFEERTGRSILNQTWVLKLDSWFSCDGQSPWISLPRGPVASITSIQYVDSAGATQTWSSGDYQTDLSGDIARVAPAYGEVWPTARYQMNAITITYVAGYGANAAAALATGRAGEFKAIQQALLIAIANMFENRASIAPGGMSKAFDYDLFWLPFKIGDDFTNYSGAA